MRLDVALIARHPGLSRRKAQAAIEKGQVTVAAAGHPVPDGADIVWDANRPARSRVRAPLPLLYEDEHLVVVDKPAGLLTVPTRPGATNEDTVLARLQEYAKRRNPRRPYL